LAPLATVLVTGCSTQTKRFWLNVFFEGVDKTNQVATAGAPGSTPAKGVPAAVTKPADVPFYIHAPFAEQKCAGCHESLYSQKMRPNLGEACLACHKTLLAEGKVWHAPAASGDCVLCHEPHQSARKFLLTQAPIALCAQCHEPADTARVPAHKGKGQVECTRCHNPHQSDNKFLLEPKAARTDRDAEQSQNRPTSAAGAKSVPSTAPLPAVSTNAAPAPRPAAPGE
jgi:predicted CXXCH cytochrome family protein